MSAWSPAVRRLARSLFLEVVELDGEQDEAPSLSSMARKAELLIHMTKEKRPHHSESAARKARAKAAEMEEWARVKEAVRARSGGRCEVEISGERCGQDGSTFDHFWSGHGRRRPLQSVESVWHLCVFHDHLRTRNQPSRSYWLAAFQAHAAEHGLASQLPLLDQAWALVEGKRR